MVFSFETIEEVRKGMNYSSEFKNYVNSTMKDLGEYWEMTTTQEILDELDIYGFECESKEICDYGSFVNSVYDSYCNGKKLNGLTDYYDFVCELRFARQLYNCDTSIINNAAFIERVDILAETLLKFLKLNYRSRYEMAENDLIAHMIESEYFDEDGYGYIKDDEELGDFQVIKLI